MGSAISPIMANIYMEFFEELALNSAPLKPPLWLRYVDDIFILWPHQDDINILFHHVNSVRPSIQFTMENKNEKSVAFLDVKVTRTNRGFSTGIYEKPTSTGRYVNFNSHHPTSIKRGLIKCLFDRIHVISSHTTTRKNFTFLIFFTVLQSG